MIRPSILASSPPVVLAGPAFAQSCLWTATGSPGERYALCIAAAGDLNGDGAADLLVGAPDGGSGSAGSMIALSGADGAVLWRVDGSSPGANLGFQVAGVGDLDGDGVGDAVGGARYADTAGPNFGEAVVVSGATGAVLYTVDGAVTNGRFGAAGDVDGDGVPDLIAGMTGSDLAGSDRGAARVWSGATGAELHTFTGADLGDEFGAAVSGNGDLNGDGWPDLLVGSRLDDVMGERRGGAYAFSGLDGSLLFQLEGPGDLSQFGDTNVILGDTNGDGFAEIAVGAFGDDLVQAFSGRDTIGTPSCGPAAPNTTGASARILAEGSTAAAEGDVTLTVTHLPANSNGIFATSTQQLSISAPGGSVGTLCIASLDIGRYTANVLTSDASGSVSLVLDLDAVPLPASTRAVMAGETRYWQYWYRDFPNSNFSDAVAITFD